ncbi:integrase core domain-containing protein [Devosia soli]|uniref:integrase core domain-containing protein n=1 Tax=Devosia soli TaxID=361041 RepID=UPI0009FC8733
MLAFSPLGKPTDNAFIERFNGKFRAEGPNEHWLLGLGDTRAKWRNGAKTATKSAHTAPSATSRRYRP